MRRRRKKTRKFSTVFALFIAIIVLFSAYVHHNIYTPPDKGNTESVSVIIRRGETARQISQNFKDKGLIKNSAIFYGYVRLQGSAENIIAGRYILNKGMNMPEIVEAIKTPSRSETVLTVQEGLTVEDIDNRLVELNLISPGAFNQSVKQFSDYDSYWFLKKEDIASLDYPLEGYLYPDTYFLDSANFQSEHLIHRMLGNFERKFEPLRPFFEQQNRSMHEIITMASILQREVRTKKDYAKVAGLLWKRLDSNWHLGADATIIYVTRRNTITAADLQIDSAYNTRRYIGMPPGPICNPDVEYTEAALKPVESEYWYYLTTLDTGEVIYSRTNEEHNANKFKYLR